MKSQEREQGHEKGHEGEIKRVRLCKGEQVGEKASMQENLSV